MPTLSDARTARIDVKHLNRRNAKHNDSRGRTMKRIFLSAMGVLALAGCATAPENITSSYVSPMLYRNWTCEQMAEEGHRLIAAYQTVAVKQNQAVMGDAFGVIMIGLPISSMTGNNVAPEVAKVKGEHEALMLAAREKGCNVGT